MGGLPCISFDTGHVGDHDLLTAPDDEIFAWAIETPSVVNTADSDFAMLLAVQCSKSPAPTSASPDTTGTEPSEAQDNELEVEQPGDDEGVPAPWPDPIGYHEAVYELANDSLFIVGGCAGAECSAKNEIWSFDHQTATWIEHGRVQFMSPAGGPVAYDVESDQIIALEVVFGDVDNDPIVTWVFDQASDTWTEMEATAQPRLGVGARMVYDTQSDRVIAFGGQAIGDEGLESTTGTWAYDFNTNTWTEMAPASEPPGVNYFAFAYDSESERSVLFRLRDDGDTLLWANDYNSSNWEELTNTNGPDDAAAHRTQAAPPGEEQSGVVRSSGWRPID